MHPSTEKVLAALRDAGYKGEVLELQDSTRTAIEAAAAAECQLGQIVKSLVFKIEPSGEPVLLLVSGENRVHEKHVGKLVGGKLIRADADFVREATGYAIGGIPPIGHVKPIKTYLDEDLQQYELVWGAAGTPHAIFEIRTEELIRITNCEMICVK